MKRARVVVLAIAFTAALGAAWVAKKIVSGPREVETVEKTVGATDVLVAATDINLGDSVQRRRSEMAAMAGRGRHPRPHHPRCPAGCADRALRRRGARALHRRRADQGAEADQDLRRRRDGRHSSRRHAGHFHADSRGDRRRRLHPSQRSRRRHFVAQAAGRLQGGVRERGGAAQCARARHRSGDREQGRRESRHRQDRDARAFAAAGRDARAGAVDGRALALLAQPRRRDPGQAETTAKIGDANSSSVKILKYGVPSRTFGVN